MLAFRDAAQCAAAAATLLRHWPHLAALQAPPGAPVEPARCYQPRHRPVFYIHVYFSSEMASYDVASGEG
jgi:hypothetical protein